MEKKAEFDIPVTEEQVRNFPYDLTKKLLDMGMEFRNEEAERAAHTYPYYTTSPRKRDAIAKKIKAFQGDKTSVLAKNIQDITSVDSTGKKKTIGFIKSDDYDWSYLLYKNWSTVEAVQTIREHGLPPKMSDRIQLLSLLRRYEPTKQIPVYYEDLIAYSANFLNAYGPKVLMDIEERGNITGCDFTNEVIRAVTGYRDPSGVYHEPKITKEEGELLFYVYPANSRITPDPVRYAVSFEKDFATDAENMKEILQNEQDLEADEYFGQENLEKQASEEEVL